MNKLIIGLLVVAAGAGILFLLTQKKDDSKVTQINKEFIIGKWKTEYYQPVKDSAQPKYLYDFKKDGIFLRSLNDSIEADTMHYSWGKVNELYWKEKLSDSTRKIYLVTKLTLDSLLIQAADSSTILFTKPK